MPFLGKTPAQIVDPEVDIDGGSIDGATIGATSASAATVTTFTSTGIDDNATSTAITIDSSQNVGINTISASGPQSTFHIEQNGDDADGGFRLSRDNALASYTQYLDTSSNWNLAYGNPASDDAPTNYLTVTNGGNVGLGSTPEARLDVRNTTSPGNAAITVQGSGGITGGINSGAGTGGTFISTQDTATLGLSFGFHGTRNTNGFFNNTSIKMLLDTGGNLLVGKTSPADSVVGLTLAPTRPWCSNASSSNSVHAWGVFDTSTPAYRFYVGFGGTIFATSTSISAISDASLKENIRDLDKGLDTILALKPRRFDWKNGDGNDIMGFIAQEVDEVLPELVHDYMYNEDETKLSLKMGDMIPSLVKAIQEQQAIIDSQASAIADLTTRLEALEAN